MPVQEVGGGRALAALPDLIRDKFPGASSLVLTVNVRNTVARDLYMRRGFVDTGRLYLGGQAGPQRVLRIAINGRR